MFVDAPTLISYRIVPIQFNGIVPKPVEPTACRTMKKSNTELPDCRAASQSRLAAEKPEEKKHAQAAEHSVTPALPDNENPERDLVPHNSSLSDASTDKPKARTEHGGPAGLEPTRFGDWERNGRCTDF